MPIRYPYKTLRPGQLQLSEYLCGMAEQGGDAIVEAPSGFGKTAAALAAAYNMVSEHGWGILYAVRTKRQVDRVLDEASKFKGLACTKTSAIVGMSDGCLLRREERTGVPDVLLPAYCKTNVNWGACGYFDGLAKIVGRPSPPLDSLESMVRFGEYYHVCPYFLSKRLSEESGVVVTTYAHLVDPALNNLLQATRRNWHDWVLIVDEAHNLPELLYQAQCSEMSLSDIMLFRNIALRRGDADRASLANRIAGMVESLRLQDGDEVAVDISEERGTPMALGPEMMRFAQNPGWLPYLPDERTYLVGLVKFSKFLEVWSMAVGQSGARLIARKTGHQAFIKVCRFDLDVDQLLKGFRSKLYVTATPNMLNFVIHNAGRYTTDQGDDDRKCVTLVWPGVSSEYSSRTPEMLRTISTGLMNLVSIIGGRIAVFFTSYNFISAVSKVISGLNNYYTEVFEESPSLSTAEQNQLMHGFLESKNALLFGVSGGRFSEGEDFSEGLLSSVIIVGLPVAPPSLETKERLSYLAKKIGRGKAYDMLVIGGAVSKVVQAAGRMFRTPGKRGILVLMDRRYLQNRVVNSLPGWMKRNSHQVDALDPIYVRKLLRELGFKNGAAE